MPKRSSALCLVRPETDEPQSTPVALPRHLRRLLTIKSVVDQLSFPSADAAREWLRRGYIDSFGRRHFIPYLRRGRIILIDPLDLDAALRESRG